MEHNPRRSDVPSAVAHACAPVRRGLPARRLAALLLAACATLAAVGCSPRDPASTQPLPPQGSQQHPIARFALDDAPFCDSCTSNVHAILDGLPGVEHVDVRIGSRDLAVTFDPRATTAQTLLDALDAGGRPAKAVP